MGARTRLLVGTKKGLFVLEGDPTGGDWSVAGPHCEAWPIHHAIGDPATGAIHAGGGNEWFGSAVWTSPDGGRSWTHSSEGLKYAEGEEPANAVWSLAADKGRLFAGVQPAGLFQSDDGGRSWRHLEGLQQHPTRKDWFPGGAGLILHHILPHPADADRLWVGISAVGVFATEDGGRTWETRNKGTRNDYAPEGERYPEFGQCVHALTMAAGRPDRLYQQNHCGMYRSEDAGRTWESIEAGLPSTFGFPAIAHPRDPDSLYLFPLNGDSIGRFAPDGKMAVWRTKDAGATWQALRQGLPQENAFVTVLRQAMATDGGDPAGFYFGTTAGEVYMSGDEGESWRCLVQRLPTITSVETMPAGG